ncbi:MAG TPA: site-specific integrase [Planctomycetaceae bacterium]|nr:site-specific integrase [Planctomycetaceae bacterium]
MRTLDRTRILTRCEIVRVIADLKRRRRSVNTRQNLIVFRLSACCGLRVSEISGLRLGDVQTSGPHPRILLPESPAKRWRPRTVPLWWDRETLTDIEAWKRERIGVGAQASDPLVCSQHKDTRGKKLSARNLQHRWAVAIKVLGKERVKRLSIQKGRHSFCSHALAGGRTITEVRDAAGHAKLSTTYMYVHAVHGDEDLAVKLFNVDT